MPHVSYIYISNASVGSVNDVSASISPGAISHLSHGHITVISLLVCESP